MDEERLFVVPGGVKVGKAVECWIAVLVHRVVLSVHALHETSRDPTIFMRDHRRMEIFQRRFFLCRPLAEQTSLRDSPMPFKVRRVVVRVTAKFVENCRDVMMIVVRVYRVVLVQHML